MQQLATCEQLSSEKKAKVVGHDFIEKGLLELYEARLQSLMQTVKIYQENLEKDNEGGALAFMCTEEMREYRVDRELELLRDVLLMEKEKLVIKVLGVMNQVKKENQALKSRDLSTRVKGDVAEKDVTSSKHVNMRNQSTSKIPSNTIINSRVSLLSNPHTQQPVSTNISIYQKLLQDKLTLIKQLQKKNTSLTKQNQLNLQKITELSSRLSSALTRQEEEMRRQCGECRRLEGENVRLSKQVEMMQGQRELGRMKMGEVERECGVVREEMRIKEDRANRLDKRVEEINALLKEEQMAKAKLEDIILEMNNKTTSQNTKPTQQSNLSIIASLKQKLIQQQQQLMSLTSSYQFLKQDISQSLKQQVKRLRNSLQKLKDHITITISKMKLQTVEMVKEMFQLYKEKGQELNHKKITKSHTPSNNFSLNINTKTQNQMLIRKLKQIDNQLDYFMEQKRIIT